MAKTLTPKQRKEKRDKAIYKLGNQITVLLNSGTREQKIIAKKLQELAVAL